MRRNRSRSVSDGERVTGGNEGRILRDLGYILPDGKRCCGRLVRFCGNDRDGVGVEGRQHHADKQHADATGERSETDERHKGAAA
jgi:hypothetical protein